jgi:nicotinamidase-related amidase
VEFKDGAYPMPGEPVVTKRVHSAFVGGDLQALLQEEGLRRLVVCGVITDNSVEATVRHGSDLGFEVVVVADACATFDKRDREGRLWAAEDVHALSLANLEGEYATVADTQAVISALGR